MGNIQFTPRGGEAIATEDGAAIGRIAEPIDDGGWRIYNAQGELHNDVSVSLADAKERLALHRQAGWLVSDEQAARANRLATAAAV